MIDLENVVKDYHIPNMRITSLYERLTHLLLLNYRTYRALDGVTFHVDRGDCLGLIGHNGCGKSTILKLIANIIRPTSGTIHIRGRVTPILELGLGFQFDLPVSDNIKIYGSVMHSKMDLQTVLDYADIGDFKDAQMGLLSPGMIARVAFATAIHTRPEILLLDEVFSVGDVEFQKKSLDSLEDMRSRTTTIFVSHDMLAIKRFCNKAACVYQGKILDVGEPDDIVKEYMALHRESQTNASGSGMLSFQPGASEHQ